VSGLCERVLDQWTSLLDCGQQFVSWYTWKEAPGGTSRDTPAAPGDLAARQPRPVGCQKSASSC
jgi:hypothetical protein